MEIVVCLDENNGMMFNHRRQSRDRVVIDDILAQTQGRPLWMNDYSAPLFEGAGNVHVSPHFLSEAPENAVCFVEDRLLKKRLRVWLSTVGTVCIRRISILI